MAGGAFGVWLVETTLVVLALAAIGVWIERDRRRSPAIAHAFWLVVLAKVATPPLLAGPGLLGSGSLPAPAATAGAPALPVGVPACLPEVPAAGGPIVWPWLWGLGAAALAALWLVRAHRFRALPRHAAPRWLTALVRDTSKAMELRPPRVEVVERLTTPCVGGVLQPVLYWPSTLADPSGAHAAHPVVGHELGHLRRRDPLIAQLEAAITLLWWWNPVLWLVRARLREAAEQACDRWALRSTGITPREYAETLLQMNALGPAPVGTVAIHGRGRGALRRRLVRLMTTDAPPALPRGAGGGFLLLAVALLPAWSVERAPLAAWLTGPAAAQRDAGSPAPPSVLDRLERELDDPLRARAAADELARLGPGGLTALCRASVSGRETAARHALAAIATHPADAGDVFSALLAHVGRTPARLLRPMLEALAELAPYATGAHELDAARALGELERHGQPAAVEHEIARLRRRLAWSGPASTADCLARLEDPSNAARAAAAGTLARRPADRERAIPALAAALCATPPRDREADRFVAVAAAALLRIGGDDPRSAPAWAVRAATVRDDEQRRAARRRLREFGSAVAAAMPRLRWAILRHVHDQRPAGELVELVEVAGALGAAGAPALPELEALRWHDAASVVDAALRARAVILAALAADDGNR